MATIFKTLVGTIASGNTSIVFTDENINNDSLIDVYFSNSEIDYNISQINNSVTVEIEKQSSVTGVALFINNSDSVDYPITADSVSYGSSDVDTELNALNISTEELGQSIVAHGVAIQQLNTNKQDTLIPGDNITIENNVISASSGGGVASWSNLGTINVDVGVWTNIPDWLNSYNEICISAPYNYELGDTIIVKDNLGWALTAYTGQNYHNSVIGQIDWQNGKITLIDSWSVGFTVARTFNIKAR